LIYCHYGIRTNQDGLALLAAPPDGWDPVIHRDIKPANGIHLPLTLYAKGADFAVLVSRNTDNRILVKLGDFGLSKIVDTDNAPASYAGTPQYQPPVRYLTSMRPATMTTNH
jgi:serine/threonine protein kinase